MGENKDAASREVMAVLAIEKQKEKQLKTGQDAILDAQEVWRLAHEKGHKRPA